MTVPAEAEKEEDRPPGRSRSRRGPGDPSASGNAPAANRSTDQAERRRGRAVQVTAAGWSVATGTVVVWVAGAVLGYPSLVVLAGGGLLAIVAAVVFVCWRPRVEVDRDFAPPTVTAGQPAAAILEVTNQGRWPSPGLTVLDGVGSRDVALEVRALRQSGSALVRYQLPTERRGRVGLGPLRVVRSDPFGLLRRLQVHGGADVLWVHAVVHDMTPLPSGVVMDLEGPVRDTAAQGSVTFSALREYVAGDDRRQIHWRSSARLGQLMVRQHVDTNEPRATVVLDARSSMWTEDSFEEAVSVAASACRAAGITGSAVNLQIVGEDLAESRALGALSSDDRLAACHPHQGGNLTALLRSLELAPSGGALVVVTGATDSATEARIGSHTRRFSPVVVCSVVLDAGSGWRRRSGLRVVSAPTAPALASAWNTMLRS